MHRIRSVGVLSVAKISGLIHAAFGLLFVPIFLLMGLSLSIAGTQGGGQKLPTFFGPAFAVIMSIFMPIFYGIMGFLIGAVGALLYNLIATWVGGIEMEVEVSPASPLTTQFPSPSAL